MSDLHLVRDPSANGGEGKSQVKPQTDRWAAIVDRIVAMLGERSRPQAEALLDRWRSILAVQLIDQAIGMCEHAEKPPRSIAYFEQTLRQTAALNDVDVPAMPAESA